VVDLHALTTGYQDVAQIHRDGLEMVADWIACGIDPERSIVFRQSDVPQHSELALMYGMITPVPWLERVPTYKGQIAELGDAIETYGFLGYPLLQTADITLYRATQVPVGQDQLPHLELAREIVRRFNHLYGPVFPEPQPRLTEFPLVLGTDNRKMSKSYGNTIDLSDDEETVVRKVRQMYTDPKRVRADIPGTVEGNPVFIYHDVFNPNTPEVDDLKARYRAGKVGDVEVKTKLATALNAHLDPIRERRTALLAKPEQLREIIVEGSKRARAVAAETMERVREAVGIAYR
jgi:tryptophanyl-tRNA synthetase